MLLRRMMHFKCRNSKYPFSDIKRLSVSDDVTQWDATFTNYAPPEYNSPVLKNKPWSDPDLGDPSFKPCYNSLDGTINRKSYEGDYRIDRGRPLNPRGRTGLCGRGILGRWGPNHAADPIVTRWKLLRGEQVLHSKSNRPILQFCAIQRRDCLEWAIPGGMVDPGENVSQTLKREFLEEALNSLDTATDEVEKYEYMVSDFFKLGQEIYKGYVDDPRNTDNAWMETIAYNFHDETGNSVGKFSLQAGDDAKNVTWIDIDSGLALYASHIQFIQAVAELRSSHW